MTLTTKNDGDREISATSPLIEGGYQWNWGRIGYKDQGAYINLQLQLILSASSEIITYSSFSSAIGVIF